MSWGRSAQVLQAENVTGPIAYHAEGPVWSARWGGLRWVDMLDGELLTLRAGRVDRLKFEDPIVAFVRPRARGGYVVGTERGIALADAPDALPSQRLPLWHSEGVRMNDGTATPDGRILAGSMAYDAVPGRGALYLVEPDLRFSVALAGVTVSNGIGFSPDGTRAYYVDSPTYQVQVFNYRSGQLTQGQVFASIDPAAGLPDGLTVGSDGSVWVALWGGAAVYGYTSEGRLAAVVELPVTQVSACTFGGAELDTLFITTSRQGLAKQDQPLAGSVFAVKPGTTGLPVAEFAG